MDTSPPPRSIQRLLLFAVLMSVSTSCFSVPPPAQNTAAATDASPSASPSPLPSSPSPTSPAPTPQTKEFDQKWKALTDAIRANLNQESAANFKKVQAAAQELNKVPNLAYDLQAYLSDSIINYPSLPPDPDYISFNTMLAIEWLPEKCKQNVNNCFESPNKEATVNGIIAALNQKYNPQSPPSPRPSPEDTRQPSVGDFLDLILLLSCGGLSVWALSKNNKVRKLLGQDISENQFAAECENHHKTRPRNEDRSPIANASGKTALKSRVQNPRDFEENEIVSSSNPAPGTNSHQEQLKRLFSQGIPVEDANMGQRRAGYEDYPVFARSSQGRSRLAVYPNPNTNELCLLPNPNTATYQYLESYFNLEPGSSPNGLLYLIQAAQVIPHGDGWRLAVKGIIRFT